MSVNKENIVNYISSHKVIRNMSAEQLDILNTALCMWLYEDYEPELEEKDLKSACKVLSVLKEYEQNPTEVKELISMLKKEVGRLGQHRMHRIAPSDEEIERERYAIDRTSYNEYRIVAQETYETDDTSEDSDTYDASKYYDTYYCDIYVGENEWGMRPNIDSNSKLDLNEKVFYSNAIIKYVVETNKNNLTSKAYVAFMQSFTYSIRMSKIVELIKSDKLNSNEDKRVIITMITADLLLLYDALIKVYCDYDYKIINSMMTNRSTSKKYINLWSLIRTKFRRILQHKIKNIIENKQYILLEYISEDEFLL